MYVIILLVSPKNPVLEPVLVNNLCQSWGGRNVAWLAPREAAEFNVMSQPDNFWAIWAEMQTLGIDLVILPKGDRRKHMLIADMDSTTIEQECIDELAAEAGVGDAVAKITALAMNGDLDFEEALTERVLMLAGVDESVINTVLERRITIMPGAGVLVATMKKNGAYCALVSGGFTAFSSNVARQLGFDEHRANTLLSEGGKLTGRAAQPILGRDAKVKAFQEISTQLGLRDDQVMAVGDGANDLGMLKMAGFGVALHAKPSVAKQCDIRINHGDLSALLFLQGYRRDEFTTE